MVKIECKCKACGKIVPVLVTEEQNMDLQSGRKKHIQLILPYSQYTPEQREMFISGMCDECWDKLFPEEDPEEDSDATSEQMELSGGCPDLEDEINDQIHETFIHDQHLIKTGTSLN